MRFESIDYTDLPDALLAIVTIIQRSVDQFFDQGMPLLEKNSLRVIFI
jgi:hypothetical protein